MVIPQTALELRRIMLRTCRWLMRVGACAALGGCAPVPLNPDAITAQPDPGRAVVIGWGNTAAENAREALTPEPGSRVSRLFVAGVNAQAIKLGQNIVRLAPGEYDLTVSCGIYIYYKFFTSVKLIHVTLEADRVYRLRPNLEGRKCEPYLDDVTGKDR